MEISSDDHDNILYFQTVSYDLNKNIDTLNNYLKYLNNNNVTVNPILTNLTNKMESLISDIETFITDIDTNIHENIDENMENIISTSDLAAQNMFKKIYMNALPYLLLNSLTEKIDDNINHMEDPIALAQGVNQLCPTCRCPILNMTATFNSTTTKQSAPDSLKTILDPEVETLLTLFLTVFPNSRIKMP